MPIRPVEPQSFDRMPLKIHTPRRSRWFAILVLAATVACGDDSTGPDSADLPVLNTLLPSSAIVGGEAFELTATGSGYRTNSQILWNGTPLVTSYVSGTTLTATIGPELLSAVGAVEVAVRTPPPGGGTSMSLLFQLNNPIPSIADVNPSSAVWLGDAFTVTVSGSGFVSASEILWNGVPLATTFQQPSDLTATVVASELATIGQREIAVRNPPPGGGTSAPVVFEITLDPVITSYATVGLRAADIVYDADRGLLYASVAGTDPTYPNTVAVLDPGSGTLIDAIQVGSEPRALAISDDDQFLYVGLDGAPDVQRIDLTTRSIDLTLALGSDPFFGPYYAEDLAVLAGAPSSVAVSRRRKGVSPRHGGVALFDDDVQRPDATQDHTGSNRIEPSGSGSLLYGYNNETTEFGLREILVTATGLQEGTVWSGRVSGFGVDIAYDGGGIFSTTGVMVEAATGAVLGTFPIPANGPVAPDVANGRALFIVGQTPGTLAAYRTSTFALIGSAAVPGADIRRVIRWGTDGLAYISDGMVAILTTLLVTQ